MSYQEKIGMIPRCSGLYCGRTSTSDGNWSDCGACPRGMRASESSLCVQCLSYPYLYDWLYLGFMVLLLLVINWYLIDQTLKRRQFTVDVSLLHICALCESILASVCALLCLEPLGSLNIYSCGVKHLSDWYTMLHNPSPGYKTTLRCTQEAVYPLYSVIFIHYAFSLLFLLLLRPLMICKVLKGKGKTSVYLTMYVIPALSLLHATSAGLLYFAYPYIVLLLSVISIAAHFAFRLDQTMHALMWGTLKDVRNMIILLGHWGLHAYGIISLTELKNPVFHGSLIALVPFPALFYILTSKFSDPSKLHTD